MSKKETKADKFQRLAEVRVNKIIKMVHLLGNLSSVNYEYSGRQVNRIFETLQSELSMARKRFLFEKKDGKRFSLSENYDGDDSPEDYPDVFLPLPDGTYLQAIAINDPTFSAINVYWGGIMPVERKQVCFVEFNPEREAGSQVCVGVYQSDVEDTKYYAPYMAERKCNED